MNITSDISLGHVLVALSTFASVAGAFYGLRSRIEVFAATIDAHIKRVDRLEQVNESRLIRLEDNDIRLTSIVQKLIGQNDERMRWDGYHERRLAPRQEK